MTTRQFNRLWLMVLAALAGLWLWPGAARAHEEEAGRQASVPGVVFQRTFLPLVNREKLPTSVTLIEQAQGRGEIDGETALIYRVFAAFADPRLPWRFRGDDSGVIDSDAVADATQTFDALSPLARETLVPFLIPPVYAGSWYDLRMNGARAGKQAAAPVNFIDDRCQEVADDLLIPLESDHFVVWFPPSDNQFFARAQQISADLEGRIHPILTSLLRQPLNDKGLGCNPKDDRLDVYLVYDPLPDHESTIALVSVYPGKGCKAAPTYMLSLQANPSEVSVMAHEFMHMIQYAYNPAAGCFDSWWMEATANWAIDYFEHIDSAPDAQMEHGYAISYLESEHYSLVDVGDDADIREYGAYLWPFYLSHYTGSYHPQLIADIFAATEVAGNGNLYKVIDDRIAGGWEARWPEFAALNLNLAPKNLYEQWDQLRVRWRSRTKFGLTTDMTQDDDLYYVWFLAGGHMTAPYYIGDLGIYSEEFVFGADVRLAAFANPYVGMPFMRLQALIKRPGQNWEGPVDWSADKWTVVCQDDPAQKLERVILIYSNSNWQRLTGSTAAPSALRVVTSDLPCAGWRGSSNWQVNGHSWNDQGDTSYEISGQATPTFTLKRRILAGDTIGFEFQPTAGDGAWSTAFSALDYQTGSTASCTRSGGGSLSPALGTLLITEDLSGATMNRQFFGSGLVPAPDRCEVFTTWTYIPWLETDIRDLGLKPWPATATVGRLRGSDAITESGDSSSNTTTSTWDLTPLN